MTTKDNINREKAKALAFFPQPFTCFFCNNTITGTEITMDHLVPQCLVRDTKAENLVPACSPCNIAKADRMPTSQEMAKLREAHRQHAMRTSIESKTKGKNERRNENRIR